MQKGIIEVAPIAFMRGRTLNDSFIILDEAQNTTTEQMKMFLTRIGFNSKAVITGDITQIDLPARKLPDLSKPRIFYRILMESNSFFSRKEMLSDTNWFRKSSEPTKNLKPTNRRKKPVVTHRLLIENSSGRT